MILIAIRGKGQEQLYVDDDVETLDATTKGTLVNASGHFRVRAMSLIRGGYWEVPESLTERQRRLIFGDSTGG